MRTTTRLRRLTRALCLGLLLGLVMTAGRAGAQSVYVPSQIGDISGLASVLSYGRVPVGTGQDIYQGLSPTNVGTSQTTRLQFTTRGACGSIRLHFGNYNVTSSGDAPNANDMTVKASIEDASGNIYKVYFGGVRTTTIAAGGGVWSDSVEADLPAGATCWVRSYLTVSSSSSWPVMRVTGSPEGGVVGSDLTDSGTVGTTAVYGYGPDLIVGQTGGRTSVIDILGDSIAYGQGDYQTDYGSDGYLTRALYPAYPVIRLGRPAETGASFLSAHSYRAALLAGANYGVCEYGVNDIDLTSSTAAQIETSLVGDWQIGQRRGLRMYQTTITPAGSVTSTDYFLTTANQTPVARASVRVTINDWIRDGAPLNNATSLTPVTTGTVGALRAGQAGHPLRGYFEVADAVESARNSGLWKAGAVLYTGQATATTSSVIQDTSRSFAVVPSQSAGWVVKLTGGTGAGQINPVGYSTSNQLYCVNTFSPAPDTTTTYTVYQVYTTDGLHPDVYAHQQAATAIPASAFLPY